MACSKNTMGTSSFLLSLFAYVLLIASSQALHHVWEESSLLAPKSAKVGSNSISSSTANYRTAYHFQPQKYWMNDPNATMFYKGYYHLFYQYNPKSAMWGRIQWGHAVSRDMIKWVHMAGAAIYPDQWYNVNGAWFGSATLLHKGGAPVILYTGSNNASEQVQAMVVTKNPSDPLLREWKKTPQNPIMVPAAIGINASSFRDPTTAWLGSDKRWRVLVGSKRDTKNPEIADGSCARRCQNKNKI